VVGQVSVAETLGATSRTVTGNVTVYHNILRVKGNSVFNAVTYSDVCCVPTGGSITTTFTATSQSGATGKAYDGKTETISFTGCGTATITGTDGKSTNVTLDHCY
jgi:hypothetical protein